MGEALGVAMAVVAAGAWRAGRERGAAWTIGGLVALTVAGLLVAHAVPDGASFWLVPLTAWLTGATLAVLIRPLAPRVVDASVLVAGALGGLASVVLLLEGARAA